MTYSSRNFLISWGVGSEERVARFSNLASSAMMSLQTSTHSSQMKTVGPAISLRTSYCAFLQNEQWYSGCTAFLERSGFLRQNMPSFFPARFGFGRLQGSRHCG